MMGLPLLLPLFMNWRKTRPWRAIIFFMLLWESSIPRQGRRKRRWVILNRQRHWRNQRRPGKCWTGRSIIFAFMANPLIAFLKLYCPLPEEDQELIASFFEP